MFKAYKQRAKISIKSNHLVKWFICYSIALWCINRGVGIIIYGIFSSLNSDGILNLMNLFALPIINNIEYSIVIFLLLGLGKNFEFKNICIAIPRYIIGTLVFSIVPLILSEVIAMIAQSNYILSIPLSFVSIMILTFLKMLNLINLFLCYNEIILQQKKYKLRDAVKHLGDIVIFHLSFFGWWLLYAAMFVICGGVFYNNLFVLSILSGMQFVVGLYMLPYFWISYKKYIDSDIFPLSYTDAIYMVDKGTEVIHTKKIKLALDYGKYPMWVSYDDTIIHNCLVKELENSEEIVKILQEISTEYDSLFEDHDGDVLYKGFDDEQAKLLFINKLNTAYEYILHKVGHIYEVEKDETFDETDF